MTWTHYLDEFQLLCSVQLSLGLYMRPKYSAFQEGPLKETPAFTFHVN